MEKQTKKTWTVTINSQTDQFNNLCDAQNYARKLLDAGLWFLELKLEKEELK